VDDVVGPEAGTGGLLPPDRAFAERADHVPQSADVGRVEVVGHASRLVAADVEVGAGEEVGRAGQDLLEQCEGGGELGVEPVGRWG
jgi:hypothetical protein